MNLLQSEIRRFSVEVEVVAADLIKRGVPPWDAVEQARRIVSRRRAEKSLDEKREGERR